MVVRRVTRLSWIYRTEHSALGNVDMLSNAWAYDVSGSERDSLMEIMIIPHNFCGSVRHVFTAKDVLHMLVYVRILD